jgi:hypothetical protein
VHKYICDLTYIHTERERENRIILVGLSEETIREQERKEKDKKVNNIETQCICV